MTVNNARPRRAVTMSEEEARSYGIVPTRAELGKADGSHASVTQEEPIALSPEQRKERDAIEGRLQEAMERVNRAGLEFGAGLSEIKDKKLYRDYGTFARYAQEVWGLSPAYLDRLISGGKVMAGLMGRGVKALPKNEAQARPLSRIRDPEKQERAWQRAEEIAREREQGVTAALVEEAVREVSGEPSAPRLRSRGCAGCS